jgi:hypothetical protein
MTYPALLKVVAKSTWPPDRRSRTWRSYRAFVCASYRNLAFPASAPRTPSGRLVAGLPGILAPGSGPTRTAESLVQRVAVIVVQVPTELIGAGLVHSWATVSLRGHAREVQVARWGLPLITHLFIRESAMREDYNRTAPSEDDDRFTTRIAAVIRQTTRLAGLAAHPAAYAQRAAGKLGAGTLPYELGTAASFDYAGFNGRGLADDVMDVTLSLTTNSALGDGVAPDVAGIRADFPYFRAA